MHAHYLNIKISDFLSTISNLTFKILLHFRIINLNKKEIMRKMYIRAIV